MKASNRPGPKLLEWRPELTRMWEIAGRARARGRRRAGSPFERLAWPGQVARILNEHWDSLEPKPGPGPRRKMIGQVHRLVRQAAESLEKIEASPLGFTDPDLVREIVGKARSQPGN